MHLEVKNQMVSLIDEMHWSLEKLEVDLKNQIKQLNENNFQNITFFNDNRAAWMEKLAVYMYNGLTYLQAIQLICIKENADFMQANKFFRHSNGERMANNTFAKFFCMKKLKKAGFKQKQIAEILGVCVNSVYKLEKLNDLEKKIMDNSSYKPPKQIKYC